MTSQLLPGRLEQVIDTLIQESQPPSVLVIDMQEYVERMHSTEGFPYPSFLRTVERQGEVLYYAKKMELPIFLVEFSKKTFGKTLPQLTALLRGYRNKKIISKRGSSAFYQTRLQSLLEEKPIREKQPLVLMGFHISDCVFRTAEDAHERGHQVITAPSVLLPPYAPELISPFYYKQC